MQGDESANKKTLDPILTIQGSIDDDAGASSPDLSKEAVTSLCFLDTSNAHKVQSDEAGDSDSDSDLEELSLQCHTLSRMEKHHDADVTASARAVSARLSLSGRLLATCQASGSCVVWDLGQRKVLQTIANCDRGPGLMLRRMETNNCASSRLMYQSRNDAGTVSLHDLEGYAMTAGGDVNVNTLAKYDTFSQSFCAATPCQGNAHLTVLPTKEHSLAVVRDWRVPEYDHPVALFHASQGLIEFSANAIDPLSVEGIRKHGMVTSLAMVEFDGRCTIGCGMESGVVAFHDLTMLKSNGSKPRGIHLCHISLGKEPVLSLDLTSSTVTKSSALSSVVAVAGLAGNAEDLTELPEADRGRIAVVKATLQRNGEYTSQLRSRIAISDAVPWDENGIHRKPGVATCRFRPDGRMFAVGGWDYRLRIFDRVDARQIAVLKGHGESICTTDWAADASESGLLATGSSDGRIQIWRCFPSTGRTAPSMIRPP